MVFARFRRPVANQARPVAENIRRTVRKWAIRISWVLGSAAATEDRRRATSGAGGERASARPEEGRWRLTPMISHRSVVVGSRLTRLRRASARLKRRWTSGLLRELVLPLYDTHSAMGVRVVVGDPDIVTEAALGKLSESLKILHKVDPRYSKDLDRYVHQIMVWVGSYSAFDRFGGIHLSSGFLMEAMPVSIAAVLVHETVHLRIARSGIEYHPDVRERIETICTNAEARFLRRYGGEKANEMADQLVDGLNRPWWTAAQRRARVQQAFAKAGIPSWLSWIVR